MNKWILTYGLLICSIFLIKGQDPQFSQFYANPLYLNPAFAGTSIQSRVVLASRIQWATVPGAFQTYSASYDQFMPKIKSGIGFNIYYDKAGSGGLSTTNPRIHYAYEIKINRKIFIRPGVYAGFVFRSIDFSKLTFGDQLVTDNPISGEVLFDQSISYFDYGAGALLYAPHYWFGFSVNHLNKPNQSLVEETSRLPIKYSIHGGYRFDLKGKTALHQESIFLAAHFKSQEKFNQLDIGAYYEYNALTFGLWYRGIPVFNAETESINNDAVILLVGWGQNQIHIGYSFDLTISQLSITSGGSHEITVAYEWANRKNRRLSRRKRIIPCAKF
jgi:type IX secretion system PorP/SprF family membrane protein